MSDNWYDKSVKQTELKLNTDSINGLKREAVKERLQLDGENTVYTVTKSNFSEYLRHLLTDYTSILMLITLMISAVYEQFGYLFVMISVLVVYYVISITAYLKAQSILNGLDSYSLPNAKVLRDGKLYMIKQKKIVRGDIIYVSAGDIVPCDARLIECDGLEVLEASVTSVPYAVRKQASFISYHDIPLSAQKNLIFATTVVTKGTGKAICCETGADTAVCRLKKNSNSISKERLKIFDSIGSFCRKWTMTMTVIIMLFTVTDLIIGKIPGQGIFRSFMTGLTLAVSSMSEFFTAFAYIVLACGIYAAVNKKRDVTVGALIKNTSKLEKIKNLTCIIVPKEAAFTVHNVYLEKIYSNGEVYSTEEHGFKRNCSRVLRYALVSTGLYGAENLIRNNQEKDNIYTAEEESIISAAEMCGEYNIELEKHYPMVQHISKGNGTIFDMTLVRYGSGYFVSMRGDYATVLSRSRYYSEDGRVIEMSSEKRNQLYVMADKLARTSCRVVAIASKDTIYNNLNNRLPALQTDLIFEGFIAIKEPILPEAAKNILRCGNAGLKIIMTSSDVSENNAIIADTLGLISSRDQVVNGDQISKMSEGLFKTNCGDYRVYQGLNLNQKRMLVRCLKENGEKVGYLCNELDEIILLKDADVGFSESITISDNADSAGIDLSARNIPIYTKRANSVQSTSCDTLKFISDVIVSEPDKDGNGGFNAIVDALICSKSVYYNLHRMLKYMISVQISRLFIVFVSIFWGIISLTPSQILFSGLVIDFSSLIIIAFERTGYPLLKMPSKISEKLVKPLSKNVNCIFIGILWAVLSISSVLIMRELSIITNDEITACSFISYILSQIAILNECKREHSIFNTSIRINGVYVFMLILVIAFLSLSVLNSTFGSIFGIVRFSPVALIGIVAVPVLLTALCELMKLSSIKEPFAQKGKFYADKTNDTTDDSRKDTEDDRYVSENITENFNSDYYAVDESVLDDEAFSETTNTGSAEAGSDEVPAVTDDKDIFKLLEKEEKVEPLSSTESLEFENDLKDMFGDKPKYNWSDIFKDSNHS